MSPRALAVLCSMLENNTLVLQFCLYSSGMNTRQIFWNLTSFNSFFILRTESRVRTRQSTSNPHLFGCSWFVLHDNFFQGFSRKYFPIPRPSLRLRRRSVLMQGVTAACVCASIGPKLALRWLCSGPTGFGKHCSTLTYPSRTQPWLKTHFWQNTSQKECMKERETESERKRGRLLKLEQYITVEKTLQERKKPQIASCEVVTQLWDYSHWHIR